MLLIYLSIAWVAGIFAGSKFALAPAVVLAALAPLPLLFFTRRYRKQAILVSLGIAFLFGGAIYYQFRLPLAAESYLAPEWIAPLRDRLAGVLAAVLPEPQASLAQGIVLGIRSNIPQALLADFSHTGTTHLLAISGQNLSIVAGILVSLGVGVFGRRHYLYIWLALAALWLYTLLTGMNPPVVRAAIMASAFLMADLLGRQRSAGTALFLTAAIMIGISPGVLGEASFQMSFMAMTGLIFISPPLQALGRKAVAAMLGEKGVLTSAANLVVDSFSVSLGAIIAVWPVIAHYFGIISWIGPVATLIAVPALPGIIVTGVLAGFIGLVALPVAQVIAWVSWLFLSYMLLVVKVFSAVNFSDGVRLDAIMLWAYYLTLSAIAWRGSKRIATKIKEWLRAAWDGRSQLAPHLPVRWVAPPLAVAAILVWVAVLTLPDDNLHASFLDIGQGDATLFQQGSQQVLIDGGPGEQAIMLALGKEMPFWDRTIDLVILTHPDADHLDGLVEVLKRYRVKQALYAKPDENSPVYPGWLKQTGEFLAAAEEKNIKLTLAQAGQQITFGSATIEVLNPAVSPFPGKAESDIDDNGVVVRVEMGEVSFLLTGDVRWQAESELVTRRANLASAVLKAGHHGSRTSTSQAFLEVVDPRVAIISAGKDNTYGHPHKEVLDRLQEKVGAQRIYRTDEEGTIELITDGTKLWAKKGK